MLWRTAPAARTSGAVANCRDLVEVVADALRRVDPEDQAPPHHIPPARGKRRGPRYAPHNVGNREVSAVGQGMVERNPSWP